MTPEDPTPYQLEVHRLLRDGLLAFVNKRSERLIVRAVERFDLLCERGVNPKQASGIAREDFERDFFDITPEAVAYTKDLLGMGEDLLQAEPPDEDLT